MMKNRFIFRIVSLFLLLYPLFTILSCVFQQNIYLHIININSVGIYKLLVSVSDMYIFWKILFSMLVVIKITLFLILPIATLIKPNKSMYILEFILITVDIFFIIGLPNNYLIILPNIFFHILTLILIGKAIKKAGNSTMS